MARRNKLLSAIAENKGVITPLTERSLLLVLEKEKRIINIILAEDQAGINNIQIALSTLKKVKRNSAILSELKRRNIDYDDLKEATEIGLKILNKMATRLRKIEGRIVVEESLIDKPTAHNFEIYLNLWRGEVKQEEKFRKFIIRQPTTSLHPITIVGILTTVGSFTVLAATSPDPNKIAVFTFSLGLALVLENSMLSFIDMIKRNQKYLDFQSKDIIARLKHVESRA